MSKAYDRIEWSFLNEMTIILGFDIKWVNLVMLCVTTVQYSSVLNGESISPIFPQRGLR